MRSQASNDIYFIAALLCHSTVCVCVCVCVCVGRRGRSQGKMHVSVEHCSAT